MFFPCT
jgi:pimeloyl-ACP methyl ester carboxylesterase